ncbi:MAG: hypothetical protein LBJ17_01710 [Dysgonamonadaceae bacterium]|jgi:hypothetical protein|nr:hypothetical protein [Dysgonamonadaceae bacterium]
MVYFKRSSAEFLTALRTFPAIYALNRSETYRKVIEDMKDGYHGIHPDLFRIWSENLCRGISGVMAGEEHAGLREQLKANVTRFAAYKAHEATRDVERARADMDGVERSGKDYRTFARKTLNAYTRYQAAEYNAVIARARSAKQYLDMTGDGIRTELYPNLKWLPSRSAHPRDEHVKFYGLTLPKNHPFWNSNQPGNLWNCKCDWTETDEPVTEGPLPEVPPAKGMEGNPAVTGEIFTDKATYLQRQPAEPVITGVENSGWLFRNPKEWRMDYFTDNEGVLITSRDRIESGKLNDHEREKFAKEWSMCRVLAHNAQKIEFLAEREGEYDILFNGKPADLKKTGSHNNIVEYASKAINRQHAEFVVFEFEVFNDKIRQRLKWLEDNGYKGKIIYYVRGTGDMVRL